MISFDDLNRKLYCCSVGVLSGPPFGKALLTRLPICSPCILTVFVILVISCFGLESRIWVLIAPVPVHCILVTFKGPLAHFRSYRVLSFILSS